MKKNPKVRKKSIVSLYTPKKRKKKMKLQPKNSIAGQLNEWSIPASDTDVSIRVSSNMTLALKLPLFTHWRGAVWLVAAASTPAGPRKAPTWREPPKSRWTSWTSSRWGRWTSSWGWRTTWSWWWDDCNGDRKRHVTPMFHFFGHLCDGEQYFFGTHLQNLFDFWGHH